MNETIIQLDMTAFYSAEKALPALRSGRVMQALPGRDRLDRAYLAFIVGASVLFDRIEVAVPAVIDQGDREDFGQTAAALLRDLRASGVASVLTVPPEGKQRARHNLEEQADKYREWAFDFLSGLDEETSQESLSWARMQSDDKTIAKNTRNEESLSEFHRDWTVALTESVFSDLIQKGEGPLMRVCPDALLRYIITNCARGFIYEAAGLQRSTFYLPHYLREGLLRHTMSDHAQAKGILSVCGTLVDEESLARILGKSRGPTGEVPLLKAPILHKIESQRAYEHEKLAELICNERETPDNLKFRERLRKAFAGTNPEDVQYWIEQIAYDKNVLAGKALPRLFVGLPGVFELVPGVNADEVEKAMQGILPFLRSGDRVSRTLRSPIYLRRHLRYLWRFYSGAGPANR